MVFQKISIPPTEGNGNCNGRGVVQKEAISEEVGGVLSRVIPGAPSKIGELSKLSVILLLTVF